MSEEMTSIPLSVYNRLRRQEELLILLRNAGLEGWEEYRRTMAADEAGLVAQS
jgi:hypothetical protein